MSRAGARFLKINHQNLANAPHGGSAILTDLNQDKPKKYFEDVSSESAIIDDAKIIRKSKKSSCLTREHNF